MTDFVEIDGHKVPAHLADLFYNADDGSRVTDEQWDEQMRRFRAYGKTPFEEEQ